jgi:putative colanic acid biosynthesis acetyltransferase WcaB
MNEFQSNRYNLHSIFIVAMYRFANFCSVSIKKNKLNLVWAVWFLILYRFLNEFVFHYEIPASTIIGKPLIIHHGYGIVINKNVILGSNCQLRHNVTIGNKSDATGSVPVIGDNVDIGAGAIIIGNIKIGDNVKIGAGAIVVKDVPSNAILVSPAAKPLNLNIDN